MAYKGNLVLVFIWLSLASFSRVRGIRLVLNQIEGYDGGEGSVQGQHSNQTTQNLLATFAHPSGSNGSPFIYHWATYVTKDGYYFGTRATINVWGVPDIKQDQASVTVISIWNNDDAIQVGVHVLPELYHDNELHFFTRWTDPDTQNWLVLRDNDQGSHLVGYWPNFLFKDLSNYARVILWGGTVGFRTGEIGPAMGSGHDPSEGEGKAAYFKNIELFNDLGDPRPLRDGDQSAFTDKPDCYKVSPLCNSRKAGVVKLYAAAVAKLGVAATTTNIAGTPSLSSTTDSSTQLAISVNSPPLSSRNEVMNGGVAEEIVIDAEEERMTLAPSSRIMPRKAIDYAVTTQRFG
uniref:Neprosin PEP catalytic domain-containing protein n=1 Tax=Ananas comosus var. bracteatus TaxID=296719 RepID=A0A6V7QS36_ANACO